MNSEKRIWLLLVFAFFSYNSFSQITVWDEDFTYADGTTAGPAGKWTSSCGGCLDANDWFEVRSNCFAARDVNDWSVWESELIDISSYPTVDFSLDASESGDHEGAGCGCGTNIDYFDVYYSIDGGPYVLIEDYNNIGAAGHTLSGDTLPGGTYDDNDFGSQTITETGLSGSTLQIKVEMRNTAASENFCLDNVLVTASCGEADAPYIVGGTVEDTSSYLSDSTFRIKLSEPIQCNTVNTNEFLLDCNGVVPGYSQNQCLLNSVLSVSCDPAETASWSGGVDTSRWLTVEIANPVPPPIAYNNDWEFVINGSATNLVDTCDNVADSSAAASSGTGAAIILPIELLTFTAEVFNKLEVLVEWITAAEKNNDYFTVERAQDGNNFETIGTVDAVGNSVSPTHYELLDPNPYAGISYYRLRQTDIDGQFKVSKVISVNLIPDEVLIQSVYPIPANDKLFVNTVSPLEYDYPIHVLDILGRTITKSSIHLKQGAYQFEMDVSQYEPGIYFLNIPLGEKTIYQKFIVD